MKIQQYESIRPNVGIIHAGLVAHTATLFNRVKIHTPRGVAYQTEVEQAKNEQDALQLIKNSETNTHRCVQCNEPLTYKQKRFCSIKCLAQHNAPHLKKQRDERKANAVPPIVTHCCNPDCNNTFIKRRPSIKQDCCSRVCGQRWSHIKRKLNNR